MLMELNLTPKTLIDEPVYQNPISLPDKFDYELFTLGSRQKEINGDIQVLYKKIWENDRVEDG